MADLTLADINNVANGITVLTARSGDDGKYGGDAVLQIKADTLEGSIIGVKGIGDQSDISVGVHGEGGTGVDGFGFGRWQSIGVEGRLTQERPDLPDLPAKAGVLGAAFVGDPSSAGVIGATDVGTGVLGDSGGIGVEGRLTQERPGLPDLPANKAGVLGAAFVGDPSSAGVVGATDVGTGVLGSSVRNRGVWGASDNAAGVFGESETGPGVFGSGGKAGVEGQGGENPGVSGESSFGAGVFGSGAKAGVEGQGGENGYGVYGHTDTDTSVAVVGWNEKRDALAGLFVGDVYVSGRLIVSPLFAHHAAARENFSIAFAVPHRDGSHRLLYSMESPESWFEDFGEAKLTNGRAKVRLDPEFAGLVKTGSYHVFVTPYSNSNGLYVSNRTGKGFEVREQNGGKSKTRF
jgi:hypothetical protein